MSNWKWRRQSPGRLVVKCNIPHTLVKIFLDIVRFFEYHFSTTEDVSSVNPQVDVRKHHADLQVLQRYLAQTTEDIQHAHQLGSPVENAKL